MNIICRGRDVKSGNWVTGDLIHNQKVTVTGLTPRTMVGGYEVDPETVGLFSGVNDSKGKKVFDGDIIQVRCCDNTSIYKLVRFQPYKAAFCVANNFDLQYENKWDVWSSMSQRWIDDMEAVVIGNIHDNPDLL